MADVGLESDGSDAQSVARKEVAIHTRRASTHVASRKMGGSEKVMDGQK